MLHTCVREKTLNIIFQIFLGRQQTSYFHGFMHYLTYLAELIHHIDRKNKNMFKYKAMEMCVKCIMHACRCYLKLSASPKKCTDLL